MKKYKKEDGYTLLELLIVSVMIGFVMLFLGRIHLSVYKTYIKSETKAQNLEKARFVVNQLEEEFRKIGRRSCDIKIKEQSEYLKSGQSGIVEKIEFRKPGVSYPDLEITYIGNKISKQNNEISDDVSNFKVSQKGDLIIFDIGVQEIEVSTTVNLQYTGSKDAEEGGG